MSNSTQAKMVDVTSAVRLLVENEDCLSITITLRDSSGDYSVGLATLFSGDSEMTQNLSSERGTTSFSRLRSTSSEW